MSALPLDFADTTTNIEAENPTGQPFDLDQLRRAFASAAKGTFVKYSPRFVQPSNPVRRMPALKTTKPCLFCERAKLRGKQGGNRDDILRAVPARVVEAKQFQPARPAELLHSVRVKTEGLLHH